MPGGTAGAIRQELATGKAVGGKFHFEKGATELRALAKVLSSKDISAAEWTAAQALYNDLRQAFGANNPESFIGNNVPPPPAAPKPQPAPPPED